MMKVLTYTVLIALLFSCGNAKEIEKPVLPDAVPKKIQLGMTKADFGLVMPLDNYQVDKSDDFRTIYFHDITHETVETLIYYFDTEGQEVLYEVIAVFKSEEARDDAALKLFGAPNYDTKEWRLTRPESYNVWAWPHKTKLVVVGMFPGTEWWDENW